MTEGAVDHGPVLAMLADLMNRQEDLHPDLVPWLDEDGPFGPSLKHPLVVNLIQAPQMNAFANESFRRKKAALAEAKAEKRWYTVVFLHERPYRIDAFLDIAGNLHSADYWELLGEVWSDAENMQQSRDDWRAAITADHLGREFMSTEEVREVFTLPPEQGGLLPETVIYRGYAYEDGLDGFSWTLDKARARWFARRFHDRDDGSTPTIASGKIARDKVIAHITSRDEQEIVCLPEDVTDIRLEVL